MPPKPVIDAMAFGTSRTQAELSSSDPVELRSADSQVPRSKADRKLTWGTIHVKDQAYVFCHLVGSLS